MNNTLDNGIAIIVDKGQGSGFIGNGQGELVVIYQTNFFDFAGVVNIVEENGDAKDFGLFSTSDLDRTWSNLK